MKGKAVRVKGGVEKTGSRKEAGRTGGKKQVAEECCKALGELICVAATLHRRGGGRQGSGDGCAGDGERVQPSKA